LAAGSPSDVDFSQAADDQWVGVVIAGSSGVVVVSPVHFTGGGGDSWNK
jgi:hypothetical protein